jgi:uncharacterized membrane protein
VQSFIRLLIGTASFLARRFDLGLRHWSRRILFSDPKILPSICARCSIIEPMWTLHNDATSEQVTWACSSNRKFVLRPYLMIIMIGTKSRYKRTLAGSWLALMSAATVISVYSLRYGLPEVPSPYLPNFIAQPHFLITHALAASVALLVGPWQFIGRLRRRWPGVHRCVGRVYLASVAVAWLSSIPLALHAYTGAFASAGFLTLGIFWIATTVAAVVAILRRKVSNHRRWMIRSYALTAAAITLRMYLGFAITLRIPMEVAYPAIAWLCWVPNLLTVEASFLFGEIRQRGHTSESISQKT